MIKGFDFDRQKSDEIEEKMQDEYFRESNDPTLSDALLYYSPIYRRFLLAHAGRKFNNLPDNEQTIILTEIQNKFNNAMTYAFIKGFQNVFSIILPMQSKQFIFEKDFFVSPVNKKKFLNGWISNVVPNLFTESLNKDAIFLLNYYSRKYFENSYGEIMKLARKFYIKGFSIGYDYIRKDILKTKFLVKGTSKMLHVPYNLEFQVTPAFVAIFDTEHPFFESWSVFFDESYGVTKEDNLIAKILVHQFTPREVSAYKSVGSETYKSMIDDKNLDMTKSKVYLANLIFREPTTESDLRITNYADHDEIEIALRNTLCRRLAVKPNQILMTI